MDTLMMETAVEWRHICALEDIPVLGSRVVEGAGREAIAIFRNGDNEVFAVHDRCPHKNGPLSQGIVHGRTVTCPLHNWRIQLEDGEAVAPDAGCTGTYPVKVERGEVYLQL